MQLLSEKKIFRKPSVFNGIDRSHAQTKGMFNYYPFLSNPYGYLPKQARSTTSGYTYGFDLASTPWGAGSRYDGTQSVGINEGAENIMCRKINVIDSSLAVTFVAESTGATQCLYSECVWWGDANRDRWLLFLNASGEAYFYTRDPGFSYNFSITDTGGKDLTDGHVHTVEVKHVKATKTHYLYVDGEERASFTEASTATYTQAGSVWYGGSASWQGQKFTGTILSVAKWEGVNRSQKLIQEYANDPFGFWESANDGVYYKGSAVAPILEIDGSSDSLVLSESSVEVGVGASVDSSADSIVLSEYQAEVAQGIGVDGASDSVVLTEQNAEISNYLLINGSSDSLLINEYSGSVSLELAGSTDQIELTESSADISNYEIISASADSVLLSENSGTVVIADAITGAQDSLVLTEYSASIETVVVGSQDSLIITEYQADVSNYLTIDATQDSIILSEFSGSIDEEIIGSSDSLVISENSATVVQGVGVDASADTLVVTENSGSVVIADEIVGSSDSITVSENTGAVSIYTNIEASNDDLIATENPATVSFGGAVIGTADEIIVTENRGLILIENISVPEEKRLSVNLEQNLDVVLEGVIEITMRT